MQPGWADMVLDLQQISHRPVAPGHLGPRRSLPGSEYAGPASCWVPRRGKRARRFREFLLAPCGQRRHGAHGLALLHFNRAHYIGDYDGTPDPAVVIPEDDRGSNTSAASSLSLTAEDATTPRVGVQVSAQHDNQFFGVVTSDGSNPPIASARPCGEACRPLFLRRSVQADSWLTLNGGVRLTHFAAVPPATCPRETTPPTRASAQPCRFQAHLGGARFLGTLLPGASSAYRLRAAYRRMPARNCQFPALHGERDQQREFGLTIPIRGWTFDVSNFRTGAKNFFDHDVLGNSNIFFPLTLERARIRGWEVTAIRRVSADCVLASAYSHQYAEWNGGDHRRPGKRRSSAETPIVRSITISATRSAPA